MSELALPVFIVLKWGTGYPPTYANVLFRALSASNSQPFRFVCLTDDPTGLDSGIEPIALPEIPLRRDKWHFGKWPKLAVFSPGLFESGTPVMLMDLDMVILGDLIPMIDHVKELGGLHIIENWPPLLRRMFPEHFKLKRSSNSSVVGFIAGEQDIIWQDFCEQAPHDRLDRVNDQDFIHAHARNHQYWPANWVLSFKKSLAWSFPLNLILPIAQPNAKIVAFHGKPSPEEVAGRPFQFWGGKDKFGFFPVRWVKRYWTTYGRGQD